MRLAATPWLTRYARVAAARRAPSARLYSRVPRSSAWPSTVTEYWPYWFSQRAWLASVACASARTTEESVSKKMRSPTLTVKSPGVPGAVEPLPPAPSAPPRPRPAALSGRPLFFLAQPATASAATRASATRL